MSKPKKPKIVGLEVLLEKQPPEEQAAIRTIKETFENFDLKNPPGKPVKPLPDGTKTCPQCGSALVDLEYARQLPLHVGGVLAGKLVKLVECEPCECSFMLEAKS